MILPEDSTFWFMLMFSHWSLTQQQSKIEQVEYFHAWLFFCLQLLSKRSALCLRLPIFLQLHLHMYIGNMESVATAAPSQRMHWFFQQLGLGSLQIENDSFPIQAACVQPSERKKCLVNAKYFVTVETETRSSPKIEAQQHFQLLSLLQWLQQQGPQFWEPLKATTRIRKKSSVRRQIPLQVSADITSPSTLCCCGLWSHHEAPPWNHSLLSQCSPSNILYLIASTAPLKQWYFLQLNVCIPKSWHLPGQVPQSLHLMLLQWEDVSVSRRAHGASNQSDSSIWIFF